MSKLKRQSSFQQAEKQKYLTIQSLKIDKNADLQLKKNLSKEENQLREFSDKSDEKNSHTNIPIDESPFSDILQHPPLPEQQENNVEAPQDDQSRPINDNNIDNSTDNWESDSDNSEQENQNNGIQNDDSTINNNLQLNKQLSSKKDLNQNSSSRQQSLTDVLSLQKKQSSVQDKISPELQKLRDQEKYNLVFKHSYSEIYQIKEIQGVILNQKRYYRKNDFKYRMRENKTYKYLLPKKTHKAQKSIVLDMDETLLYSYPEIYTSKNNFYYKTVIRPYLLEFLRELKPYYELILFTAAEEDYSRRILLGFGILDLFDHVLFRQHMTQTDYESVDDQTGEVRKFYTKDLVPLNRPLKNMCIIDDKRQRFERQPNNGIEIVKWFGKNKEDKALLYLKNFFLHIAQNKNLYDNFNFAKGDYKEYILQYDKIKEWNIQQEEQEIQQQLSSQQESLQTQQLQQQELEQQLNDSIDIDNI